MADAFSEVRPGQIISSALFNSLFTTLMTRMDDLEGRIKDLETGQPGGQQDPVAISGFSPPSQAKVNETLAILGRGFIFPPAMPGNPPIPTNTVIVNGVQITTFLFDSSPERLSFQIPASLNITASTQVTIQVSNEAGESEVRTYTILPPDANPLPQPTITGVVPQSMPMATFTAITGQVALIDGTNFLTDPAKMTVTFTVPTSGGGGPHVYTVEPSQLSALTAGHFNVVVPDITEASVFDTLTVILGVKVEGNSVAGTRAIQAMRGVV